MTENDEIVNFFDKIEKGKITEIISIFKDGTKRPWEFVGDENFTGKMKVKLRIASSLSFWSC